MGRIALRFCSDTGRTEAVVLANGFATARGGMLHDPIGCRRMGPTTATGGDEIGGDFAELGEVRI